MLASPLASPATFLSLSAVAHEYATDQGRVPALAPVDLDVRPAELVSLIGPSGCGKSTLLRIAGGLLTPSHGTVTIGEAPPRHAQRRKQIGFVFQDPSLLPWRTVAANIHLSLEVNRRGSHIRSGDGHSSSLVPHPSSLPSLLALVGLADVAHYYPHQLSGGMKQRVALARALAPSPSLLLMDEPFGALDEITRAELCYELLRIRTRFSATVLLVTHSIAEAVILSDRVVVMNGRPGRIVTTLDIDLPSPRTPDVEETEEFATYTRRLRAALRGQG